jgi:hypothetical protein
LTAATDVGSVVRRRRARGPSSAVALLRAYSVLVRTGDEPLSLGKILKEVEELLFLIQQLDRRAVGSEKEIRRSLEAKLVQIREKLADLIIQRSD